MTNLLRAFRVASLLLLTSALACCASHKPAPDPVVPPTAADAALMADWDKTVAAAAPDKVREVVNHTRSETWAPRLLMLRGSQPATAGQLNEARGYLNGQLRQAHAALDWPTPVTLAAKRAPKPIQITGLGDDQAWASAKAIPILYPAANKGAITQPPATCKLLWDEQFLYAFYDVPDADVQSPYTKRDESVSQADAVELFILPDMHFAQYWEINVSPTGVVYDCLMAKQTDGWGGMARIGENIEGMKVATHVRGTFNKSDDVDQGYTVEIAVPWTQVPGYARPGTGPKAGDHLWTLIGQADRTGVAPNSRLAYRAHLPILGWFHNVWNYSPLVLE
ncbi:MAG: carbohydrate-binding family 9-like protein [Planctomycetota bacterium]|nr:carbohydrate-binding family 9-like protein [Planctomycetota bacterium]